MDGWYISNVQILPGMDIRVTVSNSSDDASISTVLSRADLAWIAETRLSSVIPGIKIGTR